MLIPDGIWIGLPHELHNADPALGGSAMKCLLGSPVQWHGRERNPIWRSIMRDANPKAWDRETVAQQFGSAWHCMALEPDEFEKRYFVQTERPSLPKTKEDINAALAELLLSPLPMSRKSIEFEAVARLHGIRLASDWDDEQAIICAGRTGISPHWSTMLQAMRRVLERHSAAGRFLKDGLAEVSIFWTDEFGCRLKARFDYLRVRTVADLKTYALKPDQEPVAAFCQARDKFAYDVAAAHYMHARTYVLPGLASAGRVYVGAPRREDDGGITAMPAGGPVRALLEKVAAFDDPSWWWIACSTLSIPEIDAIEFPRSLMAYSAACVQLDQAKANYRAMRDRFGDDDSEMWIADRGLISLTDFNFSPRATDRGAIKYETREA